MNVDSELELSVVVIVASDTLRRRAEASLLPGTLDALMHQSDPPAFEIIVPHHSLTLGMDALRRRFPSVRFIEIEDLRSALNERAGHEHHHELRAHGIANARGRIVALTEDHARPDPDWCRRIVDAHRSPHGAIGGAIESEARSPLMWAVYFSDFGRYQGPFEPGPASAISDANVSYKRAALDAVRPAWMDGFREPAVNAAVIASGSALYLRPDIVIRQQRPPLPLRDALRERFIWGRSYGVQRVQMISPLRRAFYAAMTPALPALLVLRMGARVMRKRRNVAEFFRALPYTLLLAGGWAAGEAAGYVSGTLPQD